MSRQLEGRTYSAGVGSIEPVFIDGLDGGLVGPVKKLPLRDDPFWHPLLHGLLVHLIPLVDFWVLHLPDLRGHSITGGKDQKTM